MLRINLTYDASVSSAPAGFTAGMQAAVNYLESQFTDPVNVNINVGWGEVDGSPLAPGDIGSSSTFVQNVSYISLFNALTSDARSADDHTAVSALGPIDPTAGGAFWVSTAEAKALGLRADDSSVDGSVGFDSSTAFDFNSSDGIGPSQYDFFGTAVHEITEVMGRTAMLAETVGSTPDSFSALDCPTSRPTSRSTTARPFSHPSTIGAAATSGIGTATPATTPSWRLPTLASSPLSAPPI
jgi:hypothetical protein